MEKNPQETNSYSAVPLTESFPGKTGKQKDLKGCFKVYIPVADKNLRQHKKKKKHGSFHTSEIRNPDL